MFFPDPSENVIELYCKSGVDGAETLPRGPSMGHDTAVGIDATGVHDVEAPEVTGPARPHARPRELDALSP